MRSDVCLILEGSYPYVVGGVSTWTHHLIRSLPKLTFSIVYIGVSKLHVQRMEYKLPENVNQFQEIYLLDPVVVKSTNKGFQGNAWKTLAEFFKDLQYGDVSRFHQVCEVLTRDGGQITPHDILYSRRFWDILTGIYREHFPSLSFIDFFWTCRFLMLPLFQLLYSPLPEARVYHATCTGYAGLLAALGKRKYGSPCLLTEHGIYTNERMIEISQAQYIYNEVVVDYVPRPELGLLQNVWMKKFSMLARICYEQSDQIVTLYEGNRQTQVAHGAEPDKCILIPNGIDVAQYAALTDQRDTAKASGYHICYVGRISPIKDVKTFIRAARIVLDDIPEAIFYVLGPPDEDVDYYEECRSLAELMDLSDSLRFMGAVDMSEYYPIADLVVLTSVSEAQPFVAIEAMAVGIPVVATNVGACSELLFGGSEEDRRLGAAGMVTNVNSPEETADAIVKLLNDKPQRERMARVGRERAFRFYQRQSVINRYRQLYISMIERGDAPSDLAAE